MSRQMSHKRGTERSRSRGRQNINHNLAMWCIFRDLLHVIMIIVFTIPSADTASACEIIHSEKDGLHIVTHNTMLFPISGNFYNVSQS